MHRIFHAAMATKLAADVFVSEQTHLARKMLAVGAEEAAVERDWWEECDGSGAEGS